MTRLTLTRHCVDCGDVFQTLSQIKVRCDNCYPLHKYKKQLEYQNKRRRTQDPRINALNSIRGRAKRLNYDFDIELEDIVIPEYCPVLKVKFVTKSNTSYSPYSPSVDRIDNSQGYTKNNIQVMSRKANTMKSNATKKELIDFANWIHKTFGVTYESD